MKFSLIFITMFTLIGCVFMPKKVTYYDQECQINMNKMELVSSEMKLKGLGECKNEACIINLILPGIVTAGTAVVSGSIVVTANTIYWLEKQVQCI